MLLFLPVLVTKQEVMSCHVQLKNRHKLITGFTLFQWKLDILFLSSFIKTTYINVKMYYVQLHNNNFYLEF